MRWIHSGPEGPESQPCRLMFARGRKGKSEPATGLSAQLPKTDVVNRTPPLRLQIA
jgi:hypothetical protein